MNHAHEELLEAVLTGGRKESDPEVIAAFEQSPQLRVRLNRLRGLAAGLDEVGESMRAGLESELDSRPGLSEQVNAQLARRARASVGRRWIAVAAAAMLLAAAWIGFGAWGGAGAGGGGENREIWLDLAPGQMFPAGDWQRGEPFAWNFELPPGGRYEIRLYRLADRARLDPVLTVRVGEQREWTPTESQIAEFDPTMRWELLTYDAEDRRTPLGGSQEFRLR